MTSIIDKNKAYPLARDETNQITIATTSGIVVGLMQETLKYSIEANYEQIMNLNEYFGDTSKVANLAINKSLFNTGIATKRYYKGGSYIRIEPKIRIVDWDGTGQPIIDTMILTDAALPSTAKNLGIKNLIALLPDNLKAIAASPGGEFAIARLIQGGGIVDAGVAASTGTLLAQTKLGSEVFKKLNGVLASLAGSAVTNNPDPVTVTISNYYANTFFIDAVSVEFSKEMTDAGPLYADVSLVLSTPTVVEKGDSGLNFKNSRIRRK